LDLITHNDGDKEKGTNSRRGAEAERNRKAEERIDEGVLAFPEKFYDALIPPIKFSSLGVSAPLRDTFSDSCAMVFP
jgi:hypothetical protein